MKMKAIFAAIGAFFTAASIYFLVVALIYALSWIVTCGVVWLVTLCFGWTFKWSIATGIWLLILLAKWIFGRGKG